MVSFRFSRSRSKLPLGAMVVVVCAAMGCQTTGTNAPVEESVVGLKRSSSTLINEGGPVFGKPTNGSLINEGGPVFGKPRNGGSFQLEGQLKLPRYFAGNLADMRIDAERLDGGMLSEIPQATVDQDGKFKLAGQSTGRYFFAATTFSFDDTTHRVRALARAESGGESLTIDIASSLIAAKVALAEQKRHLYTIDYQETQDLSNLVRSRVGERLEYVRLDAANAELSSALNMLAQDDESLRERLRSWEFTLDPTLGAVPENATLPTRVSVSPAGPTGAPSSDASGK